MPAIHDAHSIYTVGFKLQGGEAKRIPGGEPRSPKDQSFDLAIVELDDHGKFEKRNQLERAAEWITARRRDFAPAGVVVLVFVHGWHHGARWNDKHLRAFRRVLRALAIREKERNNSRRVIGVYVAWNGDPLWYWFRGCPVLTDFSFYSRYWTARRISQSNHCYETLRTIILSTKQSPDGFAPSQLVLVGHSMGGLIVESSLRRLIKSSILLQSAPAQPPPVKTEINGQSVIFPDAVLSLNSAADSRIVSEIDGLLTTMNVSKWADARSVSYAPPLLISATSTADFATRVLWRLAYPLRRTTGHNRALLSHVFQAEEGTVNAKAIAGPDFGQNFHVLRPPDPAHSKTPRMRVDLPVRDRTGENDHPPHRRYRLDPKGPVNEACRIWNFQVPPELMKDHNDVFNSRAISLILALMQISGTVGSLAPDWEHSFEPYP